MFFVYDSSELFERMRQSQMPTKELIFSEITKSFRSWQYETDPHPKCDHLVILVTEV
jgi:hypothetical protein